MLPAFVDLPAFTRHVAFAKPLSRYDDYTFGNRKQVFGSNQVGDDGLWLSVDNVMDEHLQGPSDNDLRGLILEELRPS
jgi:hypothetical protein